MYAANVTGRSILCSRRIAHLKLYKHLAELLGARCSALGFKRRNLLFELLDLGRHELRELGPFVSLPLKETIARRRPTLPTQITASEGYDRSSIDRQCTMSVVHCVYMSVALAYVYQDAGDKASAENREQRRGSNV